MICKNCNTENLDNAIYCKTCGTRIDGKKICPVCDYANKEEDAFCGKCGARIDGKKFCANCGNEVDGAYCTACGQKYGAPVIKNKCKTEHKTTANTFWGKTLDITGSSFLMLGAVLSLILIFFIGYNSKLIESNNIYYYFIDAYTDLSTYFSSMKYYTASYEISYYISTIMKTIVISVCLIGCIICSIVSIVNFIKKMCFGADKNPAIFPLLTIALYLICAISFRNMTYSVVSGMEDLYEVNVLELNSATKTGITLASICALLYYTINIVNNALTLQKNQIAKFVTSIITTISLIVLFILLSNCFVTANINYEYSYQKYIGSVTLSFPMAAITLSAMTSTTEMIGAVIISSLVQILLTGCSFITLFAISKSMNVEKNNLPIVILISVLLLLTVILSAIGLNLFVDYIYEINIFETSSIEKYLSLDCAIIVVSLIISIIPLATSITNSILNKGSTLTNG